MQKKILVFSDGTGNSSAKAQKTNVWRLFQAVDQSVPDQLAKYDDGVGTSRNKYLAALGGAFGYGLKRNVIDLYKFVCRNHRPGDEIYGFGFSRGAFTIRMLVGLVGNQGLVPFRSEEELHANAVLAYRRFRSERFTSGSPFVWLARRLRDLVLWPFTRRAHAALAGARRGVPVRFLGLWDTVAAYGMPIDELKWGISLLIWPMATADHKLSPAVQRACHALSLDDERQTFHPILFDESGEPDGADRSAQKRITQVWFAGVHSNVGGGYPEDQLSLVSLDWMISQLEGTGLRLDMGVLGDYAEDRSAYARIYDSRAGLGTYYRYAPRAIDMGSDAAGTPIVPIVHGSVVMRMAAGSDSYAPIALPHVFDVLAPDGSLLPMHGFAARVAPAPARALTPATSRGDVEERTAALKAAIAAMNPPGKDPVDIEMVRQVHDTVWWRRVMYFACLFSTLLVVAFPYAAGVYSRVAKLAIASIPWIGAELLASIEAWSRWFTPVWRGWTADLFHAIGTVAPAYAKGWLDALAQQPLAMLLALALAGACFAVGMFLARRVHDRAWFAWHADHRADYLAWSVESAIASRNKAFGLVVAAALAWTASLSGSSPSMSSALLLATLLMIVAAAWRIGLLARLRRDSAAIRAGAQALPSTPTLEVARFLRSNAPLVWLYHIVSDRAIPIVFALALAYGVAGAAYHLALRAASSAGEFCGAAPRTDAFDTSQMCWASGVRVQKGQSYEVTLTTRRDWFDQSIPADASGIAHLSLAHAFAEPMKRSWGGRWFQPIVRVGIEGDDEYVMQAAGADRSVAKVRFTAQRDAELYFYVNDAILLLPGMTGTFYANNRGSGTVSVTKRPDEPEQAAR